MCELLPGPLPDRQARDDEVGISNRPMPLPFVISSATTTVTPHACARFSNSSSCPIDDSIANSTRKPAMDNVKPLSLFSAEPVDFSLHRRPRYTGTSVKHFPRFFLPANYQRYIEVFHTFRRPDFTLVTGGG